MISETIAEAAPILDERSSYYEAPRLLNTPPKTASATYYPNTSQTCDSKYYQSMIGANPLLAAASPIFSLASRLQITDSLSNLSEVYLDLIHEIHAFETQAKRFNYRQDTITIARYLLAATLDEILIKKIPTWRHHALLQFFQQEDVSGERFFLVLERLAEEPAFYIDLLELMYVSLSLGYEGKFANELGGHHALNHLKNEVFYKICQTKRELRPTLNVTRQLRYQKKVTKIKTLLLPSSGFLVSTLVSLGIMASSLSAAQWQALNPLAFLIY